MIDKTGTLTHGQPQVTDFERLPPASRAANNSPPANSLRPPNSQLHTNSSLATATLLASVAALESRSEHPLAEAIVAYARPRSQQSQLPAVEGFEAVAGCGVRGVIAGRELLIGTPRWLRQLGLDTAALQPLEQKLEAVACSVAAVVVDGRIEACFGISDPLKPSSAAAVAALRRQGLQLVMLSGDARRTAELVAGQAGIERVIAEVRPADKAAVIRLLQAQGEGPVAMVGDGINDAPALAQADVGIAMGTGTDVAIAASDITLISGNLAGVPAAIELSRQAMANIRQNLFFAFAYNVAGIPIAAGLLFPLTGWLLSPMIAGAAMAFSSLSVVGNALRLRRFRPSPLPLPLAVSR